MNVGLVYDDRYLAHAAPDHVERPARLTAIRQALEKAGLWQKLAPIPARAATDEELLAVHTAAHLAQLRLTAGTKKLVWLDGDTYAVAESWQAAILAAGGVCAATDAVMRGDVRSAFCAVRPPGHHATANRAMGFCLLNNVAIAARHLQKTHNLARVLILDFDVHHGNGTQEAFYRDGGVMYVSVHESPLYPGTGAADEMGEGPGAGHILNFPLAAGSGEAEFLAAWTKGLAAAEKFQPEFVLMSVGFDAHKDDLLGHLKLSEHTYAEATRLARALADRTASGRLVSTLEGGYNLDALGACAVAHVRALMAGE
jgi:acetoin utilization deacetylase AcuC-like enzyme